MGTPRPFCESKINDHAWANADKICKLYEMGILKSQLAKRFGVSTHTIDKILRGVSRRHSVSGQV